MDFSPEFTLGAASQTCPRGMALQSLAFEKHHWSADEARAWARGHDYPSGIDTKPDWNFYRVRVKNPDEFLFFRWGRPWKPGLFPVYGCPKAKVAKTSRQASRGRAVAGIGALGEYEIVETYAVLDPARASKHFSFLLAAGQGLSSQIVPIDAGGFDVVSENNKVVRFIPKSVSGIGEFMYPIREE